MILPYLILSHLIGDFVLQPTVLVKWKMRSYWGILVHVLVHFIVMSIVFIPFLLHGQLEVIYPIIAISLIHFVIDRSKISYDLGHNSKVKPFVLDQILHIITIVAAAYIFIDIDPLFPSSAFYQIYTSAYVISFISLSIFVSEFIEIYQYQKLREKNAKAQLKINQKKVSLRIIVFTLLYIVFMLLSFVADSIAS